MDSELLTNRLARASSETTGWDANTLQPILDWFQQPLYRYYAVHTDGDVTRAQRMTAETFVALYRKPLPLAQQSLSSGIFGIAWDVLNAHLSHKDGNMQADSGLGDDQPLIAGTLRTLRPVALYPREALYLRCFAALDLKDIVMMMDKSEASVKNLIYQGVREFACRMNDAESVAIARKQLLALAQEYHLYLSDMLAGNTPMRMVSIDLMQATHQLNALRTALSMKPESRLQLNAQVQQLLRAGNSSATRL